MANADPIYVLDGDRCGVAMVIDAMVERLSPVSDNFFARKCNTNAFRGAVAPKYVPQAAVGLL